MVKGSTPWLLSYFRAIGLDLLSHLQSGEADEETDSHTRGGDYRIRSWSHLSQDKETEEGEVKRETRIKIKRSCAVALLAFGVLFIIVQDPVASLALLGGLLFVGAISALLFWLLFTD